MPSKQDILFMIAVYVEENKFHPNMYKYIKTVLKKDKSGKELEAMTKEELWGLIAYFAKDLEKTMREIGGI
jgi:hypothetical protein